MSSWNNRSRSSSPSKPPRYPGATRQTTEEEIKPYSGPSKASRSRSSAGHDVNADSRASRADRTRSYASQSLRTNANDLQSNLIAIQSQVRPVDYPPAMSPPRRASRRATKRERSAELQRTQYDPVALGFLGIVSISYIVTLLMALNYDEWNFEDMNFNPWFGPSSKALISVGAQSLTTVEEGEWWRLFSSPFVNAGIIQVATNLIGLWSYGMYAARVLPIPWLSVPVMYLVSSVMGAMASANLNAMYAACGASAGVCAFIGISWTDSIVNPRPLIHNKISSFFSLFIVSACYITISLLPLVDVWFAAVGLLAGFFGSMVLLLLPKVGKGEPKNALWVTLQIISVVLLFGAATTSIIGLALDTKVGENTSFLQDASCLDLKWWYCLPQTNSTSGCTFQVAPSGSTEGYDTLTCPSGARYQLSGVDPTHPDDPPVLSALCSEYCGIPPGTVVDVAALAPGSAPGPSSNVGGEGEAPSEEEEEDENGDIVIQPGSSPSSGSGGVSTEPYTSIRTLGSSAVNGRKLSQGRRMLALALHDDIDGIVW